MRKQRTITFVLGVLFAFALGADSVRADAFHVEKFFNASVTFNNRNLDLPDTSRAEQHGYLMFAAHAKNGKHLGFSVSFARETKPGNVTSTRPTVSENPEPATMILMGTGLAAVGAMIRRRRKA
jgi:hypothetical protein